MRISFSFYTQIARTSFGSAEKIFWLWTTKASSIAVYQTTVSLYMGALSSRAPPLLRIFCTLYFVLRKKHTPKGVLFLGAEKRIWTSGYIPATHDFQSCSLNHSDISAYPSAYLYYCIFLKNASVFHTLFEKINEKYYFLYFLPIFTLCNIPVVTIFFTPLFAFSYASLIKSPKNVFASHTRSQKK